MIYAIPSRARADVLVAKTLPLLDRLGIPSSSIHVFVASAEIEDYARAVDGRASIHPGALGMAAQRHAIHDWIGPGEEFVSIDDDLRDLVIADDPETLRPIAPAEWRALVDEAFDTCRIEGARLWGLYPVPNAYFMRRRITTRLTYIGGGLWGCVNRNDDGALNVSLEDKEDFERSIKCYLADGAVVRHDYVSWRTSGYHGDGGMQEDGLRTDERIRESAEILADRYPDLCSLNLTKKSGKAELRLRDRRAVR